LQLHADRTASYHNYGASTPHHIDRFHFGYSGKELQPSMCGYVSY